MAEQTQEPTQATPVAAPATPVPAAPTPSPAVPTTTALDPDVFGPDGKRWKDKAIGARGWVKQIEEKAVEEKGQLEAQIAGLAGQIGERDAAITQLTAQVGTLTETADTIPGLQEQIEQLQQQAVVAERYKVALEFPALLALQTEEVVKDEDGNERTETRNPMLALIESSSLDQPGLRDQLKQLAAALPQAVPQPIQQSPVTGGATPSPAAPAEGQGSEHWYSVAMKLQARMNEGEQGLFEQFDEAWKQRATALVQEGTAG